MGIVVLANSGDAGALLGAVNRRLVELLFDGKPEAKDNLVAATKREAEAATEDLKLVSAADPAWFDTLAGGWKNPGLGRIDLRRDKGGATLDAGEWKVAVGKKTDRDGTVKLITTGVPIVGLELEPREKDGKKVLVVSAGQHEYVFERVK